MSKPNLSFFGQRNSLQDFSFNINSYFNLFRDNMAGILGLSHNLTGSSNWFVRFAGYLCHVITYPLSILYGLGSSIFILILCIVQYVVNFVGFMFWGISGIANGFLGIASLIWSGVTTLLQVVWIRFIAFASVIVGIIVPSIVSLNQKIIDKLGELSVSLPEFSGGDFEGVFWLFFNKLELNYFIERSLELSLWSIEILLFVLVSRKIIDIIKVVFARN